MKVVVSACQSEIEVLIDSLPLKKIKDNVWVGESYLISFLGIGYFHAALELENILSNFNNVESVLFTGTAGYYGEENRRFFQKSVCVKNTALFDLGVFLKKSKSAKLSNNKQYETNFTLPGFEESYGVLTTQSVTIDRDLGDEIYNQYKLPLENLELFGIAEICSQRKVPWGALLGITNQVNSEGSNDWLKNHKRLELQNCEFLLKRFLKND